MSKQQVTGALRQAAVWFEPSPDGFGPLIHTIGDASLVLIGEASHGTHEFYRTRAELTKALILRKGFNAIAVEADWPDAYRVNRWVRHVSGDGSADAALGDFKRFPRWMWRNLDVVASIEWLRGHNAPLDAASRVGFYGLDLYSLHRSAASNWDEPAQRRRVVPSMPGSYERLLHDVGIQQFQLRLGDPTTRDVLLPERFERAIGVIYRPDTERVSHYFRARLPDQFDAIVHIDETHALEPLEPWSLDEADLPETYPSAL